MCLANIDKRMKISIHALREEGDFHFYKNNFTKEVFLSTPSARRATAYSGYGNTGCKISIHALREEGDQRLNHARVL